MPAKAGIHKVKENDMSEVGLKKSDLDTPLLWVDLDKMEANIAALGAHFKKAGVDWRPHIKGIKIPAIAHKAIAAGAIGVTCAKLGEAEVMAAAGITDLLVANQVVGPRKMARLVNLRRHADVKVAIDNRAHVEMISQAATAKGVEIGVLVELNTGMNRAGVAPGEATVALSRLAHETPGVRYMGLMAWEGHTLTEADPDAKRAAIEKAVGLIADSAEQCRAAGLPVSIVSGGGSGTYQITPFLSGITEMQAGGAIFNDISYQSWGVTTTPALFVRSVVTSRPAPDRIIFDAGFKTLPTWHAQPQAAGLDGVERHSASAEHGVMRLEGPNEQVQIGDAFDFMLGYTDETLFLHDHLYGIRDGVVEVVWEIAARGKLR